MKIYTKKGDKGTTDLLYKRVNKTDLEIEVNGTIDELISFVGFANSLINNDLVNETLKMIIKDLSTLMSGVASNKSILTESDVKKLENLIDKFDETLPVLTKFVYFEDKKTSASLNITRTVSRRAERLFLHLNEKEEVNKESLKYLNRLSDLFFIMARYVDNL